MEESLKALGSAISNLLAYCTRENWSGFDPYDALNSRLFAALPLQHSKLARIAFTQAIKRSPVNLRPLLMIPKGENPKACALFASALIRLSRCGLLPDTAMAMERVHRLMELRSTGSPYVCWGYNFDWQNRSILLPKFTPNIICTSFGGNALLDVFEAVHDSGLGEAAASAAQFILNGLTTTREKDGTCFSYTPLDHGQVHNANLLGAAFLGRVARVTSDSGLKDAAVEATRFSLSRQRADGSWPYGEDKTQQWVDSFHTGYNLVALKSLQETTGLPEIPNAISRGLDFYIRSFFTEEGAPKYYHDGTWPIDIHSAAQAIVTLSVLSASRPDALPLATKVCTWTLSHMRSDNGWFYFQKNRFILNRISYMRWSQAWMLYALAALYDHSADKAEPCGVQMELQGK